MKSQLIEIEALNTPTALTRVIEIVQRHRVNIQRMSAEENENDKSFGSISITIKADDDKTRLLKAQCARVVEVIDVT